MELATHSGDGFQHALGEMKAQQEAILAKFHALQLSDLSTSDWFFVAQYYGLRAALVLIIMFIVWTMASWATSLVRFNLETPRLR